MTLTGRSAVILLESVLSFHHMSLAAKLRLSGLPAATFPCCTILQVQKELLLNSDFKLWVC